ncbi:hypothetical protein M409DRAFT_65685 [Zasmidium cellare ATCC 36951]|uniref:TRUD domain-containing protein n=1 Tax=Zasmidium cellare ATCC 36951 TaxID=1080233 RepID=A0A6A6CM16_ZASCE|nr:uncharacterized protein M409DRAFT_65685 [Zasmidium cellare ATCC 36951]KAF2168195.1 hypothetical protein M409DRAFT_65685 [Zasmidium cellare ATCC 36951]
MAAIRHPNEDAAEMQDAQERAVGISVFVRPDAPGFRCTVKQRYTDFLVNEIQPNGETLHLTEIFGEQDKKRKREEDGEASRKKQREDEAIPAAGGAEKEAEDAVANGQSNGASASSKPEIETTSASVDAVKAEAIASISDEDKSTLNNVFGEKTTSSILNLYAAVVAFPDRKARDHAAISSDPFAEKSKRTEAHMCIRRIFKSKLETITVQEQEHQSGPGTVISIKAAPPKSSSQANGNDRNSREGQRGKQQWSDLGGEYLHFSLYKENKDTMEVLSFIGSQLKMHMKHVSFAGTKDRRGVTVQRVAIHRVHRHRIEGLNRIARGWKAGGPWEYKKEGLELGMLSGNEFLLTLRDARFDGEEPGWSMEQRLNHAKSIAETAAQNLHASGYLNYYGLQRFGTYSTGTHIVGMKMLKGDLQGAVDSLLSYDESLLEESSEDRKVPQDDVSRATAIHNFLKNRSSNEALSELPSRFNAERGIITHIGKRDRKTGRRPNENDFQGALMSIQRQLRLMYVHAYQSFVWNTVAGKRWETFGDKVVEGDLVVVGEKEQQEGVANGNASHSEEVDEDGEPIIHPSATTASGTEEAATAAATAVDLDDLITRARPLSKTEAESGRFSILDVVLPLPGFDVEYPKNVIGQFYTDFMASENGGGIDPHNMRRAWKDISLPGGYRKLMSRPLGKGVEVEVKAYSGPEEQMVETDLERLQKAQKAANGDAGEVVKSEDGATAEKDRIAVVLKMQLGSSQYATMALRELTKGGAVGYRPDFSAKNR